MGTIVVGVDGSDGAQRALGFAIEEAKRRGTRVRVVMAWHVPAMAYGGGFAPPVDPRDFDESSRAVVEDAVSKLAAEASGVEVERVTRSGQTVQVLVEEARGGELLIVGSRGLGGFAGLLLGSVSLQCAHHADCPVVIVPEPVRTEETSNRTIVVGIDGSPGAQRGLEWAAREARLRNARLKIMLAWQLPFALYAGPGKFGVERELLEELRKIAADRLDEACSAAAPALEGLAVERSVVEAEAAPALIEAAKDADLLVVGTRGHGGFAGLLLGSVSQHCAHHARCPVVIVPPPRS